MKNLLLPVLIISAFFYFSANTKTQEPSRAQVITISKESLNNELSVGNQIRVIRESKSISQAELAEAIGLTINQVQTIESGMATPTRDIIFRIQELLEEEIIIDR